VRAAIPIAIASASLAVSAPTASATVPAACANAEESPAALTVPQTRAAITCLLNAARDGRKLPAVRGDDRLHRAAQGFARALDPAKPLTHVGHGGTSPLDRVADSGYARGAASFSAAETLGRSRGTLATPARRVESWLASPGTRRLLLNARYRDIGVGVVSQGGQTTYVVEVAARVTS
jgi:uncharacterized protein YkwD